MSIVYKFQDVDKLFTMVIDSTFLNNIPNPEMLSMGFLLSNNLLAYLHNPLGPALRDNTTLEEEYWIDGENITNVNPELVNKIKHNSTFNDKLEEIINE